MKKLKCCILHAESHIEITHKLVTSLESSLDITLLSSEASPKVIKNALLTQQELHLVILISSDIPKTIYSLLHMMKAKKQFACAYFGSQPISGPRTFDLSEPELKSETIHSLKRMITFLAEAAHHSQKETAMNNAKIHLLTQLTQLTKAEISTDHCVNMIADSLAMLCQSRYLYICDEHMVCKPVKAHMQQREETPPAIQQAIDEKKVKVSFDEEAADIIELRKVEQNIVGSLTFPIVCNDKVLFVIHCYLPDEMLDAITLETISLVEQACYQLQIILERLDAQKNLEIQHKELEKTLLELQTTKAQLYQTEKLAAIGQLAAGIAHEINNPLAFVASNFQSLMQYVDTMTDVLTEYSQFMTVLKEKVVGQVDFSDIENTRKESDVDFIMEDIDDLVADSKDGIDRIREIIDNLLLFSRKDAVKVQEYNLEDGLRSTLKLLNTKLKDGIKVETDFASDVTFQCKPGEINQVFLNILQNAADALDGIGEISIQTKVDNSHALILIRDNGPGIPDEIKEKIFEPFFTTKAIGKGTGLGLSISFSIIEQHGGSIKINTREGEFTEFVIRLPIGSSSE